MIPLAERVGRRAAGLPDNNGLLPARPGHDLATGIGTPDMAQLITAP